MKKTKIYRYSYGISKSHIAIDLKTIECEEVKHILSDGSYVTYEYHNNWNVDDEKTILFSENVDVFNDYYAYSLYFDKEKEFLDGVERKYDEDIKYLKGQIKELKSRLKIRKNELKKVRKCRKAKRVTYESIF